MYSTVLIALIVLFGAALIGKMLMDMYPGSVFGGSKGNETDDTE